MKKTFSTKTIVVCGSMLAIAFITNNLLPKIRMPYSGSITLFSMFFIYISSYLYGSKVGIITAVCYGILDLLISPSILHPLQVILDYPISFGMLGLGGIFCKGKYALQKGYIAGCIGRLLTSAVSGWLFFAEYAPAGQHPLVYSLLYNAGYILPEMILTLMVISLSVVKNAIDEMK